MTNGDIMSWGETQQPDVGGFLIPAPSFTVTGTPKQDCISEPPRGVTAAIHVMVGLVKNPTAGLQTTEPPNPVKLTQNRLNRKSNQDDIKL